MTIYDFIVVGAGPAGISFAIESKLKKCQNILIFEKGDEPLIMIRDFYKNGKRVDKDWKGEVVELKGNIPFQDGTKETTIELFQKLVSEYHLNIRYRKEVEKVHKQDNNIFRIITRNGEIFHAKQVVIAIGNMGKPNKPSYPIPTSIKKVVNFNTEKYQVGEKILVVGGGNSATEYAYQLSEECDVTLCYRKNNFNRVNEENLQNIESAVKKGKLKLKLATDIDYLSEANGKIRVHFSIRENEVFDRIIYAIGGSTPIDFLKQSGVQLDEKNNIIGMINGLYLIGDISVKSGGSIAKAIQDGYELALKLCK